MPFAVSLMGNASCRAIYIGLGANQAYRGRAPLGTLNSALRCLAAAGVQTIAASRLAQPGLAGPERSAICECLHRRAYRP